VRWFSVVLPFFSFSFSRAQSEIKERRKEEFRAKYWEALGPLYEKYQTESQRTLGGIHKKVNMDGGEDLSESITYAYEAARPRPHIVARRKALYKYVFRVCKIVWPDADL
jgi:hypothetical protein